MVYPAPPPQMTSNEALRLDLPTHDPMQDWAEETGERSCQPSSASWVDGDTPAPHTYGSGQVLGGKYRLGTKLGEGSMGTVWAAENEVLGIPVALKLIRSGAATQELTERLLTEARAAARLSDPAIVRIFDFGHSPHNDPYIVMERLDGRDLGETLARKKRLSGKRVIALLLPVIRALGTAHDAGIVHRDLKPENIFLSRAHGRVQPKLLDFGIAKLQSERNVRLTDAGAVLGSPMYMSPEQAMGRDADHRTDIWAVCVIMYEAISGSMPFRGDNFGQLLESITRHSPNPLTDLGETDAELWALIAKGLEKDRALRWQSMREFGTALARWLLRRGVLDDIAGASLASCWLSAPGHSQLFSSAPPGADPARYELSTRSCPVETRRASSQGAQSPKRSLGWIALSLLVMAAAGAAWSVRSVPDGRTSADGPPNEVASGPVKNQTGAQAENAAPLVRKDAPVPDEPPLPSVQTTAPPGEGGTIRGNPALESNPAVEPKTHGARKPATAFAPARLKDPFR